VVFVVPLIGFKVAAAVIAEYLPGGTVQTVDRMAGAVFGVVRGAVIVCAAYLALTILAAPEEHPDWVKNALVLPYVKDGAVLLSKLMPEDVAAGVGGTVPMPRRGHALRALIDPAGGPARP
jgi:membrane protein required for colicin V production